MPHLATCDCANESASIGNAESLHENIQSVEIFGSEDSDVNKFKALLRDPALRFDDKCHVKPDVEGSLLIAVHFINPSTLHAITMLCQEGRWCDSIKLFRDEPDIDLEAIQAKAPIQSIDIAEDPCGRLPHSVKVVKFRNSHSILILASQPGISIQHIGLFGEISKFQREAPANVVYEARANPADHPAVSSPNLTYTEY